MYESPIIRILGDIQSQIIRQEAEKMIFAVNKTVGYEVDKQELIKALNYDRDQYHIGFEDARKMYERPKGEWINGKCKCCGEKALYEHYYGIDGEEYCEVLSNFCPNCGADMRGDT